MITGGFQKERDDEKRVWVPEIPRGIPEETPTREPDEQPQKTPEREKELEPVGV